MYLFDFHPYRRPFLTPLRTHHGLWSEREGIIIRLRSLPSTNCGSPSGLSGSNQIAFGEIAPIPWFGSETQEVAIAFCRSLPSTITAADINAIPATLTATRFAFESALVQLTESPLPPFNGRYCGLLPTGDKALETFESLLAEGFLTLKWKIGVATAEEEIYLLETLCDRLPPSISLRLDANGGLTPTAAKQWLAFCDTLNQSANRPRVEFIEQPFPPARLEAIQNLSKQFKTEIALDESVATVEHLESVCQKGWTGIVVVKPAIAGSPKRLMQICQKFDLDVVVSSSLETSVGTEAALRVATQLGSRRAVGFGVTQLFPPEPPHWPQSLWQSPLS